MGIVVTRKNYPRIHHVITLIRNDINMPYCKGYKINSRFGQSQANEYEANLELMNFLIFFLYDFYNMAYQ